jgi:hypothetical protein
MKKIYVGFASYRDPYLQSSIDSLMENADNPKNITIGCFIQFLPQDLPDLFLTNVYGGQVNYSIESAGKIFSVTECRNKSLIWLNKEHDYVLQVDAHTRFDKGWDTQLLTLISSIDYPKPLLSGNISVFDIKEDGTEVKTPLHGAHCNSFTEEISKKTFLDCYELVPQVDKLTCLPGKNYAHHWYILGCFIFAPAEYFKSITQPDWVMFWGEEILNGLRAFTAGWNVYVPESIPLYHLYSSIIKRPRIWEDFPNEYYKRRVSTTDRIIDILLDEDLQKEDLFFERSLKELYLQIDCDLGILFDTWRKEKNGTKNELH